MRQSSRIGRKITLIILFSVTLIWCAVKLLNPATFPIRAVNIIDSQAFIDHAVLRETISPFLYQGMVRLEAKKLEKILLSLPWVQSVNIQRQWPDKLIINIIENKPAAHWDKVALINTQGKIFAPNNIPLEINNQLPWLYGTDIAAADVWQGYQNMSSVIAPLGLKIIAMSLSPSDIWQIELNNGIPIVLGKDDALQRLQKFVKIYPKLFDNNANAVEYIDLRYNNGLAVKWKSKE